MSVPPKKALTKRTVDALDCPPGQAVAYAWDVEPKGFGVRANPGGRKVYLVTYRTLERRQRFHQIAPVGTCTIEEARQVARDILFAVAKGEDPSEVKAKRRDAHTLEQLKDAHLEWAGAYLKPGSVKNYKDMWKAIMKAPFASKTVWELKTADVQDWHQKRKDTPYAANNAVRVLSAAVTLAIDKGWREKHTNPCDAIEHYAEKKRVAVVEESDLGRIGPAIEAYPNPRIGLALRLYLATGCRKTEVLAARYVDVNYMTGTLYLPDTKGGGADGEYVDLSDDMLAEIRAFHEADKAAENGNPWIIPGQRKGKHMVNIRKPWTQIREAAGMPHLRIHDLRHVFGSYIVDGGGSPKEAQNVLRHKQMSTSERYIHASDKKRRKVTVATAERIAAALKKS